MNNEIKKYKKRIEDIEKIFQGNQRFTYKGEYMDEEREGILLNGEFYRLTKEHNPEYVLNYLIDIKIEVKLIENE